MVPVSEEEQLELFDLKNQAGQKPRCEAFGRFSLQFRYDQIVLSTIAVLVGLTVVFACGVERGKQLVRTERSLLVRQQPVPVEQPAMDAIQQAPGTERPTVLEQPAVLIEPKGVPSPTAAPKAKPVVKVASKEPAGEEKSRYAIQVSTYSRPQSARQELERLKSRGERAFLVMRDGRTVVYVGPFPSKTNAREKLTALKVQYQDCFLKTL